MVKKLRQRLRRDSLVLLLEMIECFIGVEVEDDLAGRQPAATLTVVDARRVAEIANGLDPFHVAAFDGLEFNGDADQRDHLAGVTVAGKHDVIAPIAVGPAEAAWFAALARRSEEVSLEMLALLAKAFAGTGEVSAVAAPQDFQAQHSQATPAQGQRQPVPQRHDNPPGKVLQQVAPVVMLYDGTATGKRQGHSVGIHPH
jgi:hypothetical protein